MLSPKRLPEGQASYQSLLGCNCREHWKSAMRLRSRARAAAGTGRWSRWWRTTRWAAATCARATCWAPARCRARCARVTSCFISRLILDPKPPWRAYLAWARCPALCTRVSPAAVVNIIPKHAAPRLPAGHWHAVQRVRQGFACWTGRHQSQVCSVPAACWAPPRFPAGAQGFCLLRYAKWKKRLFPATLGHLAPGRPGGPRHATWAAHTRSWTAAAVPCADTRMDGPSRYLCHR